MSLSIVTSLYFVCEERSCQTALKNRSGPECMNIALSIVHN